MTKTKQDEWMSSGLRFECQQSGRCCTSHGEFGFVYLTREDRAKMAKHLGLTAAEFKQKYCEKTDGIWHLIERKGNPDCLFLKGKQCGVYEARPTQCRTWPFWPDNMNAKTWKSEIAAFCPGIGKGPVRSLEEIKQQVAEQKRSDTLLGT